MKVPAETVPKTVFSVFVTEGQLNSVSGNSLQARSVELADLGCQIVLLSW